jgi:hypothetical protein
MQPEIVVFVEDLHDRIPATRAFSNAVINAQASPIYAFVRHSVGRRTDGQRIPQRLGSSGHSLIREQLRMYNVTRPVINQGNEILTRIYFSMVALHQRKDDQSARLSQNI